MPLGMEAGLGPGHMVRWDTAPPAKGHTPNFRPISVVAKTARWIKMPLRREVELGPSDIVRWGSSQPRHAPKGAQPPIFGPCLLWPSGGPSQLLLSTWPMYKHRQCKPWQFSLRSGIYQGCTDVDEAYYENLRCARAPRPIHTVALPCTLWTLSGCLV